MGGRDGPPPPRDVLEWLMTIGGRGYPSPTLDPLRPPPPSSGFSSPPPFRLQILLCGKRTFSEGAIGLAHVLCTKSSHSGPPPLLFSNAPGGGGKYVPPDVPTGVLPWPLWHRRPVERGEGLTVQPTVPVPPHGTTFNVGGGGGECLQPNPPPPVAPRPSGPFAATGQIQRRLARPRRKGWRPFVKVGTSVPPAPC